MHAGYIYIHKKHTWVAHRVFTRRAGFLHRRVRTRVLRSAYRAGVIVGIERAATARFAFGRIPILGGDEFLARGALQSKADRVVVRPRRLTLGTPQTTPAGVAVEADGLTPCVTEADAFASSLIRRLRTCDVPSATHSILKDAPPFRITCAGLTGEELEICMCVSVCTGYWLQVWLVAKW